MTFGGWIRKAAVCALILLFLLSVFIQLVPSSWLRALPEGESHRVNVAIVLGFGYEQTSNGVMRPGAANEFLLHWVLDNYPEVDTILVQEGIWAVVCETTASDCKIDDVELLRIHRHDPEIYVDTFDTAVCAIDQMNRLGTKTAILVAHDLQLWRVAREFNRVRQELCEECEFVIPAIPDTPYPTQSVHRHTRNEFVYRFVEMWARFRNSGLFRPEIPDECIAPLPDD